MFKGILSFRYPDTTRHDSAQLHELTAFLIETMRKSCVTFLSGVIFYFRLIEKKDVTPRHTHIYVSEYLPRSLPTFGNKRTEKKRKCTSLYKSRCWSKKFAYTVRTKARNMCDEMKVSGPNECKCRVTLGVFSHTLLPAILIPRLV